MTMITQNPAREGMEAVGRRMPRPNAVLVVTAHWTTHGETRLTGGTVPHTIHDFRGFPQELYEIEYPAPGSPELAARAADLIGERAVIDEDHGFDHGVWGVLLPMFPGVDIPVVAMSVDMDITGEEHVALGRKLAPLRDEGVAIIGSGNIVHNLMMWRQTAGTRPDWAIEFQQRTNSAIKVRDFAALANHTKDDSAAQMAINSREHYLPLLYPLGASNENDGVEIFNDTIDGSLSMTSFLWGDAEIAADLQ